MDFVVNKSELLRELQYVQGVVERKSTVPILSNLLLEISENGLAITATDLDVTLQCNCPAEVKESGSVTVSARKLFDIARLLPEAEVHFKASSNEWVSVRCERSRFKVAGLSKENFPEIPPFEGDPVTLPAGPLRYMINRAIFAITQEESRYTLNGALMMITPKHIRLVTTDGHRLVLITKPEEVAGVDSEIRVLVPKKTLAELAKLASDDILTVDFSHTENHLFFRVGERLLVSRILTGQFPNYEMVIPKENDRKVTVSTLDFSDALRRVAIMADEQSRAVRFAISPDQIDISSASSDYGEAKETVPAGYSGEAFEIGFNAQYLLEFLAGLDSETIAIEHRDRETQGLLRPEDAEGYEYSYVVMPMKL